MKPINLKKVIEDTVYTTVITMGKTGMLKGGKKRSIEKVEELLRKYPKFKEIKDKHMTKQTCVQVEQALARIKTDKYYDVIELFYFENQPVDMIAGRIGCSTSAAFRNKARLVDELATYLFSDEVIREILL